MADRPIIFSGGMVKALLAGNKTQTRRILKKQDWPEGVVRQHPHQTAGVPYAVGDRLWVRESVRADELATGQDGIRYLADEAWLPIENSREAADRWVALNHYGSTAERPCRGRKVPSIHMPRTASRLTLVVGQVSVERLLDITEEAAQAEGVCHFVEQHEGSGSWEGLSSADRALLVGQIYGSSRRAFQHLWETLHGTKAWEDNPWIAATSFAVTPANIDSLPEQAGGRA